MNSLVFFFIAKFVFVFGLKYGPGLTVGDFMIMIESQSQLCQVTGKTCQIITLSKVKNWGSYWTPTEQI